MPLTYSIYSLNDLSSNPFDRIRQFSYASVKRLKRPTGAYCFSYLLCLLNLVTFGTPHTLGFDQNLSITFLFCFFSLMKIFTNHAFISKTYCFYNFTRKTFQFCWQSPFRKKNSKFVESGWMQLLYFWELTIFRQEILNWSSNEKFPYLRSFYKISTKFPLSHNFLITF